MTRKKYDLERKVILSGATWTEEKEDGQVVRYPDSETQRKLESLKDSWEKTENYFQENLEAWKNWASEDASKMRIEGIHAYGADWKKPDPLHTFIRMFSHSAVVSVEWVQKSEKEFSEQKRSGDDEGEHSWGEFREVVFWVTGKGEVISVTDEHGNEWKK